MRRRYILLLGLCLPPLAFASADTPQINEKNLYFGEAFYHAYQGNYFDAITRLDIGSKRFYGPDKPNPDPLHFKFGDASITVGDFELSYRMPQLAGRTIKAVFESKGYPSVRNEAAYRLARIYLQNGEPQNVLQTIEKITGKIPEDLREDALFLRAQIYMSSGRFADAVKTLRELQNSKSYNGFAAYNLGFALLKSGQEKQGLDQLDAAGKISGDDDVTSSIRDKANLALGYRMMDANQPALAKQYLDRVRLSGPFSNKALLGSGWADAAMGKFDRALVPWSVLAKRNVADQAVQESMLGVPYAYAKLDLPGKSSLMYGRALEKFGQELARLDASVKSVRDGKFLQAMLQPELKQDKDWIARLRALPETPETYYLLELMTSDDFQESLRNYLDLDEMLKKLESWDVQLIAYEELIRLRRQYYESALPDIDKKFLVLDPRVRLRLDQRQKFEGRIKDMLALPPPENDKPLAEAYKHLQEMDVAIRNIKRTYAEYSSLRKSAPQSYQGYDDQLRQLKNRIGVAKQIAGVLMNKQGQILATITINDLNQRRKILSGYLAQARFALAESYERASQIQVSPSGAK